MRIAHAQKGGQSTQKLIDDARAKFEDQQYDESIQKLSAALLRQDATKTQKIEVYRWLAYNYIVLKQEDAAKNAVYLLYALDEDYALGSSESPKFRDAFKKFKEAWVEEGKPGVAKTDKVVTPVAIKHIPGSTVPHDQSVSVGGTVEDPDKRVAKVALFYRTGSSGKFIEVAMPLDAGAFKANIPGTAVKPPILEYYVLATDKGGIPIASRGDADTPLRLAVEAEQESITSKWWFWGGIGVIAVGGGILTYFALRKKDSTAPSNNSFVTITISE